VHFVSVLRVLFLCSWEYTFLPVSWSELTILVISLRLHFYHFVYRLFLPFLFISFLVYRWNLFYLEFPVCLE